jgi:hypothetical protein
MKLKNLIALIVLAGMLSGCGTTLWTSSDYESTRSTIDTVAFILPHIYYVQLVHKEMWPSADSADIVSHRVANAVTQLMGATGFLPHSAVIVMAQLQDSLRLTRDGGLKYAVTPELLSVLHTAHAKYFLWVQGKAYTTPEKLKQDDLLQIEAFRTFYDLPLLYDYQWSGLRLEISLVSASGDVLWYNRNLPRDSKYDPSDIKQIRSLCETLMSAR